MRLRSFLGTSSSSSAPAASTCACARSPRARACASTSSHGRASRSPLHRGPRERLRPRAQRGALAERERDRAVRVAEREARAGLRLLGRDALTAEALRELVGAGRVEAHRLAAAGDRRQHVAGARRQQHEVHVGRRLLERLEHPVGGLVVELVGVLDDEDAARRLERGARRRGDDGLVDVADEDPGGARRRDPGEVGMDAVLHAHAGVVGVARAVGEQLGGERARRCAPSRCPPGRGRGRRATGCRRAAGRRRGRRGHGDDARATRAWAAPDCRVAARWPAAW